MLVEGVACGGFLERTPSRTTLAHDGAAQEKKGSAGREGWWCCCSRDSDPLVSLPCGLALPDDRPAPSTRGEGLPSPSLGVGREAAGSMTGGASPLSAGRERELGPHTSRVRSKLTSRVRSKLISLGYVLNNNPNFLYLHLHEYPLPINII